MKTCLIPPIPHLEQFGHGEMHLLLDHLCNRKKYVEHYRREKVQGSFLILDNSAHEHQTGAASNHLLEHALQMDADEMAVPDVLWKGMDTLARVEQSLLNWTEKMRDEFERLSPRIMLIPQGEDYQAWKTCLFGLMLKWHRYSREFPSMFKEPPTLGISKDYEIWEGGIHKLLKEHIEPLVQSDSVQVHLLGWGRDLWKLNQMAQEFPWIRSSDTAKPFVFGLSGIMLDPENEMAPEYPKRPEKYFDVEMTEHQLKVAEHNVHVFQKMALGKYQVYSPPVVALPQSGDYT